jgi:hypothetical protein
MDWIVPESTERGAAVPAGAGVARHPASNDPLSNRAAMSHDYEDPPVNTRRGRISTAFAIFLIVAVLGSILWFAARNWTPDEPLRETDEGSARASFPALRHA